jgi:primosomal protein N'
MKIKEITSQNRRDFYAVYECEHCGWTEEGGGYDDSYFHNNVIPKMKCGKCGKIAPDSYRALTTKYPDGFQV